MEIILDKSLLAKELHNVSFLTGNFKLRSGQNSQHYFDKYRFESNPQLLASIAHHLKKLIPPGTEVLAGLEMGGIPIATALSLQTGLPVAFIRKSAKEYGTCQVAEGSNIRGKNVLVIEDVITTGGQVVLSTQDLRGLGAYVTDVLCVILRGDDLSKLKESKLNVGALFTMDKSSGSLK